MTMKMQRCLSASILLMLSLEGALLVSGNPSAAATIRPPQRHPRSSVAGEAVEVLRPGTVHQSIPPICHCADEVEQCDAACKDCVPSTAHPSLFVCNDQYVGDPGPICRPWNCMRPSTVHQVHPAHLPLPRRGGPVRRHMRGLRSLHVGPFPPRLPRRLPRVARAHVHHGG
ncbi:hypothetical protein ACQ4PT_063789 [Festuca glaucescens]